MEIKIYSYNSYNKLRAEKNLSVKKSIYRLYTENDNYENIDYVIVVDVTYQFLLKMDVDQINNNKTKLLELINRNGVDISSIKKEIKHTDKNIHLFFYYLDNMISKYIYIVDGGFMSPLYSKDKIFTANLSLVDNKELIPLPVQELVCTYNVPSFRLPKYILFDPEEERVVNVRRMIDLVRELAVYLNHEEDACNIVPEEESLYGPELNATDDEELLVLCFFVASVSRNKPALNRFIIGYKNFLSRCLQADRMFFAKIIAANPDYISCKTNHQMIDKALTTITGMAMEYEKI